MKTGNYYGARYYDPRLSIFLSVDPLVEKTMTAYVYCNNNPVNLIDPTGREAIPPDDHFDHYGNFLYTDHKKTNNIIIHYQMKNPINGKVYPMWQQELKDHTFHKGN